MKKMDDLKSIFDLIQSIGGPQVECEALKEWHGLEQRSHEAWGGRIVAVVFGALGVAAIAVGAEWELFVSIFGSFGVSRVAGALLVILMAITVGFITAGAIKFGRRWAGANRYRDPEIRRVMGQIVQIHSIRRLRKEVGDNGVAELNEGAIQLLRCKSALTAEPWTTMSPGDPWLDARNEMMRSMETAMGRLLVFVMNRRPFSEISSVLEQMRAAANEAVRVTEVRSHSAGSAGRDLRASIARMRELTVAEDELLHIRDI